MRTEKKEYLKPEVMVCECEMESLLDTLSSTESDNTGGDVSGPETGGGSSTDNMSKEYTGSLWDFDEE